MTDAKKYSIKVISNSCGILPHTLRIWEKRYSVFNPERSAGGQRLYSEQDLKKANLIASLIEQGHAISNLARYSLNELEAMRESIVINSLVDKNLSKFVSTKDILKHVTDYNLERLALEIKHQRINLSTKDFIFHIILPLMQEIGTLVAKGKLTVTQEHIVSTIVRDQLTQIVSPNVGEKKKEVVLATPEGNLHELSIIIGDLLCRANRVPTRYLGAAHPSECLGQALNTMKTRYLVLGTVSSDQWDYKRRMIPYLEEIDELLRYDIQVILGGGLQLEFPKFDHIKSVQICSTFDDFDEWLMAL